MADMQDDGLFSHGVVLVALSRGVTAAGIIVAQGMMIGVFLGATALGEEECSFGW
jgi:hypothetical protein